MSFFHENAIFLFSERNLGELVRAQIANAHIEIDVKDADELLNMPVDDQIDIIVAHFQLLLPTVREDLARIDEPQETMFQRTDYGRQISVPATRYTTRIPFEGDKGLFRYCPATHSLAHPLATLEQRELVIQLVGYNITADDINNEIDKTVASIKQFLECLSRRGSYKLDLSSGSALIWFSATVSGLGVSKALGLCSRTGVARPPVFRSKVGVPWRRIHGPVRTGIPEINTRR